MYKQENNSYENDTTFYDYDISNGYLYRATGDPSGYTRYAASNQQFMKPANIWYDGEWKSYPNGVLEWANKNADTGNPTLYAYTKEQGINIADNYKIHEGKPKLAFGNANTGTGLDTQKWNNALINKHNSTKQASGNPGYEGCAFGLVTGLADGKLQYNEGISAPYLFNEGATHGKTELDGYSLVFNQKGDTYTLQTVKQGENVASPNLDKFNNPTNSAGKHKTIWTNNFWPMDTAPTYGTSYGGVNHDIKFGDTDGYKKQTWRRSGGARFPESDDGQFHNSYFGMHFGLNFNLTEDYMGPLEYCFFGDDDMWVFLDNQLICDIGGVHSSVGEYVNLWDYLGVSNADGTVSVAEGKSGEHTLEFFYTERGASGSTCWMQFTLPSVSSKKTGSTGSLNDRLTVGKAIDGNPTDTEFAFKINLRDANGKPLDTDAYPYTRYYASGKEYDAEYTIIDGGTFYLKAGERIGFKYLPDGATFTIEEIPSDGYTISTIVDGTPSNSGSISIGTETPDVTHVVNFVNKEVYYALPETGGPGPEVYTAAGALILLFGAGFVYKKKFRERRV